MWNVVIIVLSVMVVINALLLIGLILIQQSKSGGLSGTFGGAGQDIFGGEATSYIVKLTVGFTASFFILTLTLAIVTGHRRSPKSAVETVPITEEASAKKSTAPSPGKDAPPGSFVKKVKGGTITFTPVPGPNTNTNPQSAKKVSPGSVKVLPNSKQGSLAKKVKAGSITLTPKGPGEKKHSEKPSPQSDNKNNKSNKKK